MPVEVYLSQEGAAQEYETVDEADLREDDVIVERIHEDASQSANITLNIISTRFSSGINFSGMFMSLLNINGQQLTNLTAYNEYITDVIVAVIVYLAAFMLIIKMWISKRKPRAGTAPAAAAKKSKEVQG